MGKRLALFHNKPIDRTQFDQELLDKQLDLETLSIELKDNETDKFQQQYEKNGGQCSGTGYRRIIERETNEEGKFKRLIKELEDMAKQYGITFDKALEIFESVSCSKKHFRECLEKKTFTVWTALDDMALSNPQDSAEFISVL